MQMHECVCVCVCSSMLVEKKNTIDLIAGIEKHMQIFVDRCLFSAQQLNQQFYVVISIFFAIQQIDQNFKSIH